VKLFWTEHKVPFLSCPKSVVGHPELIEKTGFPSKDCGNDGAMFKFIDNSEEAGCLLNSV
jgi:hypothetical protein